MTNQAENTSEITANADEIGTYQLRPNSHNGLWLMFLLPTALIASSIKHSSELSNTYKLIAVQAVGLISTSILIVYEFHKSSKIRLAYSRILIPFILCNALLLYLKKGLTFSLYSSMFCSVFYLEVYNFVLTKFTKTFTIGEASIASQAATLLLYATSCTIYNGFATSNLTVMQISTITIQMGLLGILVISAFVYKLNIKDSKAFYLITGIVLIFVVLLPLHVLLKQSPVLWILFLIFGQTSTLKMILYWVVCSSFAILAVMRQVKDNEKASTVIRKIFHLLAVFVYIPGLLFECSLLYLASGVMLGLFFAIELVRILRVPPLGDYFQDGFTVFSDEKDVGVLAATPIYLLTGCSLPLWIHPAPCDVTDSSLFNLLPLLSGILSIGIGDTAASVIGSKIGRIHWPDSKKTIEGTLACILSQVLLIGALTYFGYLQFFTPGSYIKTGSAVFVTSLVEAHTDQVDNLILPLIMYILLVL